MPRFLDQLLICGTKQDIDNLPDELDDNDAKFLQLGLAYHISRKQDSVRLSKKIIVKNYHKEERELEEKEEKAREVKETAAKKMKAEETADQTQLYLNGQA